MSGGVGPTCDITLPNEQQQQRDDRHQQSILGPTAQIPKPVAAAAGATTTTRLLSIRQLNCLALMIILSASGMVCLETFAFVPFSVLYMVFLSKFAFPPAASPAADAPVFSRTNKLLRFYILFTAIIGLILPVLYIFEGVVEGDKQGIQASVPHVFLLASQVFMEGVSASGRFSLPIRVFVPVFYNSGRIGTLIEWVRSEMEKDKTGQAGSGRRLVIGRVLAVMNFVLWAFNLFGFLLPVYLPKAFKRYYSDSPPSKKD